MIIKKTRGNRGHPAAEHAKKLIACELVAGMYGRRYYERRSYRAWGWHPPMTVWMERRRGGWGYNSYTTWTKQETVDAWVAEYFAGVHANAVQRGQI